MDKKEELMLHMRGHTRTNNFGEVLTVHCVCNLTSNKESGEDLNPAGELASADNITPDC